MDLASVCLRGIHPPENIQNGDVQGGNREFTNVRRRRQDDGYQYNDINPIVQKKWIIKSLAGVLDVVQALLTTAKCIFSRPV